MFKLILSLTNECQESLKYSDFDHSIEKSHFLEEDKQINEDLFIQTKAKTFIELESNEDLFLRELNLVSSNLHLNQSNLPLRRSQFLYIVAIPKAIEYKKFYEDQLLSYEENIQYIRLVKRKKFSSFYSLIIKMKSQNVADSFFNAFNGRFFSEENTEIMYTVFMSELILMQNKIELGKDEWSICLPSCPLCLEKLDVSVSGLQATLLYEAFIDAKQKHKWENLVNECTVCRIQAELHLCMQDNDNLNYEVMKCEELLNLKCSQCENKQNLWVCLVCASIGCGRYKAGHAVSHYQTTQHFFALELSSQRIWNYQGDNYVHRIIKTPIIKGGESSASEDQMLVLNLPDSNIPVGNLQQTGVDDRMLIEKIENTIREYNYLLTSQLEEQRNYYEEKIEKRIKALRKNPEIAELDYCIDQLSKSQKTKQAVLDDINKEIFLQKKKNTQLEEKTNKVKEDLELSKEVNKCMKNNLNTLQQEQQNKETQQQDQKSLGERERLMKQIQRKKESLVDIQKEIEELMNQL